MLTEAQIRDDRWRERLSEKYGWMSGGCIQFECLGGWRFLLEDTLSRIDATLTGEERDDFFISQVKEKFGELRVYHNGSDTIGHIVECAEAASSRTCDVCGGPGRLQGQGWISVRCRDHETWRG
jgi:hypothetical protein